MLAMAAVALTAAVLATADAGAATVGALPPHNPSSNCAIAGGPSAGITQINACRAAEGVGPMSLPSNFSSLTAAEQLFVLIDLERVNRGLAPAVGLSAALNRLAQNGANASLDPSFPSKGFTSGGAIWAGGDIGALAADNSWMYHDGPGSENTACTEDGQGCWGHRDNILAHNSSAPLVIGAAADGSSYAAELLFGYSTKNLMFTWQSELKYFASAPGAEPLDGPARKQHRQR